VQMQSGASPLCGDRASPGSLFAHPRYAWTASQPYISLAQNPSQRQAPSAQIRYYGKQISGLDCN
ncbi:hypothetical protein QN416_23395, partial [Glaciimonas sp. Cout2]|uniref:hypothetical protein n=1 Tax=Glaciimonas sp. Cout2 TaxID=3048621 RepID=UPI002B227A82